MEFNRLIDTVAFCPLSLNDSNAWIGHIPFAAWVIKEVAPAIFVELGTYSGNSYFSFCQSVKTNQLNTKCYAVDTWQGDEHSGLYSEEIFQKVSSHQDTHYAGFSRLLRMKFDEALSYFSDGSVDLLHIDGFHTYEAVKHDFETWLPKLSNGAIVLFHDINVREREFGVWRYWEELKEKYPFHLEFDHCHGLGVLQVGGQDSSSHKIWLSDSDRTNLRRFFAALGQIHLDRFDSIGKDRTFQAQQQIKDQQINNLALIVQDKEQKLNNFDLLVQDKEQQINNLALLVQDKEQQINNLALLVQDKEQQINNLALLVQDKEQQINHLALLVQDQELQISNQYSLLKEHEISITNLNHIIADLYASTSWRICAPLRRVSKFLRKIFL